MFERSKPFLPDMGGSREFVFRINETKVVVDAAGLL